MERPLNTINASVDKFKADGSYMFDSYIGLSIGLHGQMHVEYKQWILCNVKETPNATKVKFSAKIWGELYNSKDIITLLQFSSQLRSGRYDAMRFRHPLRKPR